MHVRQLVERRVAAHPDKPFLMFDQVETSYGAFDAIVNQVSNGFRQLGVEAGARVCVMLSNCPPFLYAWFALMKLGAILVPINSAFRSTETQYITAHSGAVAIIVAHNHPSGDPSPSREDREVTERLTRAGQVLGIRLLDSVVVSESGYFSIREEDPTQFDK